MKRIFLTLICLLFFVTNAWSADYIVYVDADCATPGDGTSGTCSGGGTDPFDQISDIVWASAETAAGLGDEATIYLQKGDTWAEQLVVTGSGASGFPITITSYGTGAKPIIDGTGLTNTFFSDGEDYITLDGLDLRGSDFTVRTGANVTDLTVQNCDISESEQRPVMLFSGDPLLFDSNTVTQSSASIALLYLDAGGGGNSVISNNTFIGDSGYTGATCTVLNVAWDGLEITGNTITNWYCVNGTPANGVALFDFDTWTDITFDDNIITLVPGQFQWAVSFDDTTITSCDGNNIVGAGRDGILVTETSGASSGTISNNDISQCTDDGILIRKGTITTESNLLHHNGGEGLQMGIAGNTDTVTSSNDKFYFNEGDGVNCGTAGTLIVNHGESYNNGLASAGSSGDGYTSHAECDMTLDLCEGYNNFKSGVAVVGTDPTIIIRNSVFYNNYEGSQAGNYGIFLDTTGAADYTVTGNRVEKHEHEIYISAQTVSGGPTLDIDRNIYGIDSIYWASGTDGFHYDGSDGTYTEWLTATIAACGGSPCDASSFNFATATMYPPGQVISASGIDLEKGRFVPVFKGNLK